VTSWKQRDSLISRRVALQHYYCCGATTLLASREIFATAQWLDTKKSQMLRRSPRFHWAVGEQVIRALAVPSANRK
jgi:hypothetical protein